MGKISKTGRPRQKKQWTEKSIQKAILFEFHRKKRHKLCISNIFLFNWESDVISIDRDNMIFEFEIKCSKWDYLNDFKKEKKHSILSGENIEGYQQPNYFYYVAPDGLIDEETVPEYAGLLTIKSSNIGAEYLTTKKKAPAIHNSKTTGDDWERLAIKLFYKLNDN